MQTIYYETSNFIRHEGNLVDLAAYRQKLAAVSGGNWSPAPEGSPAFEAEAPPRTGSCTCKACQISRCGAARGCGPVNFCLDPGIFSLLCTQNMIIY